MQNLTLQITERKVVSAYGTRKNSPEVALQLPLLDREFFIQSSVYFSAIISAACPTSNVTDFHKTLQHLSSNSRCGPQYTSDESVTFPHSSVIHLVPVPWTTQLSYSWNASLAYFPFNTCTTLYKAFHLISPSPVLFTVCSPIMSLLEHQPGARILEAMYLWHFF